MFPSWMFDAAGKEKQSGLTPYGTQPRQPVQQAQTGQQARNMAGNANMWMALAAAAKQKNQQQKEEEAARDMQVAGVQGDFASQLGYPSAERDVAMSKERDNRDFWEFALPHNWGGTLLGAVNKDAGDKWKSFHK